MGAIRIASPHTSLRVSRGVSRPCQNGINSREHTCFKFSCALKRFVCRDTARRFGTSTVAIQSVNFTTTYILKFSRALKRFCFAHQPVQFGTDTVDVKSKSQVCDTSIEGIHLPSSCEIGKACQQLQNSNLKISCRPGFKAWRLSHFWRILLPISL